MGGHDRAPRADGSSNDDMEISGVTVPGPARRFILASGGLTLLAAGFAQFSGSSASAASGATAGRPQPTVPKPRGRQQGGAPFPGQTVPSGDSHTGTGTPPPDTVGANPADQFDPPPLPGKPQFYVHEGPHAIALTIDDGPDPRYTPQVLALLAKYNIPATFCMLGSSAHTHPGLVGEVAAAGHLIANHTYTHADLSRLTAAGIRSEVTRAHDALTAAGANAPRFFRAPYGSWSPAAFQVCAELGLRPLDWSVDPKDWSRPGTDHIVSTVLGHTRPGSIILEHDGGGDRSQTVAALTQFLPKLIDAGYKFVQP